MPGPRPKSWNPQDPCPAGQSHPGCPMIYGPRWRAEGYWDSSTSLAVIKRGNGKSMEIVWKWRFGWYRCVFWSTFCRLRPKLGCSQLLRFSDLHFWKHVWWPFYAPRTYLSEKQQIGSTEKLFIYIYIYIYIYMVPSSVSPPPPHGAHGLGPQVAAPIPFYLQAIGSISEVQLRIC